MNVRKSLRLAGILIGLVILAWVCFILWQQKTPLLSPITSSTTFSFLPDTTLKKNEKVVYGFLPYWNLDSLSLQSELTHIAYFGLTIGSDGHILTQTENGIEPGFAKLGSDSFWQLVEQSRERRIVLEVVVTQFNNDDIVAFLNSPTAQTTSITSLDSVLLAYPFTGVNIDIVYSGVVSDPLREKMTLFMENLNNHIKRTYTGVTLSIDMYSSAANRYSIWEVKELANHVDYIVIMAYDFHRRSSPVAGPVAPLFGGKVLWDSDISDHLQAYVKAVPSRKLLLGVPFYGYEWQTTTSNSQAFTLPNTGVTASYKRVQEVLSQKEELGATENWNDEALSPYITYTEEGTTHVIYYDNSRSLSYKLDFVNQLDLGGMAIWAIGYEGDYRELWDVIFRKM